MKSPRRAIQRSVSLADTSHQGGEDTSVIQPEEVTLVKVLGKGQYGTVWHGICRSHHVAVKVLHEQNLSGESLEQFRNEIAVLSRHHHPNIVLYMGACTVPHHLMIVTELMKGDLRQLLADQSVKLGLLLRLSMAKAIALGMNWLHSSAIMIVHRDLKPTNILYDDTGRVAIADFGLSETLQRGSNTYDRESELKGTAHFMAPEALKGAWFNEKVDVYAFALVLYEIVTRRHPWVDLGDVSFAEFRELVCFQQRRPPLPDSLSGSLRALITDCWQDDYRQRPSFTEITDRLDHIILEHAIADPDGRAFWKEHFFPKDKAPWREFADRLAGFLGLDLLKLEETLKPLLAKQSEMREERVTIEQFGLVLAAFGPLRSPSTMPNFLQRIRQVLSRRWFHGDITTEEAMHRLVEQEVGTFLVRFSFSCPGRLVILYVAESRRIKHYYVYHKVSAGESVYTLGGEEYDSLLAVVRAQPTLLHPCSGSRFSSFYGPEVRERLQNIRASAEDSSGEA